MGLPRLFFSTTALLIFTAFVGTAQRDKTRSPTADWPMFNRDLAGTRYSPLSRINTTNVGNLNVAWTYKLRPHDGKPLTGQSPSEIFQEVTPIVVNGVMYLPAANRVVALEPETGKETWSYELKEGQASFRGVSYWAGDKNNPPRILFTTARKLVAINAVTGEPSTGFGNNGEIELKVPYDGAPTIYKNIILMGSNFYGTGQRHIAPQLDTSAGEPGDTHAYDARTGKEIWEFHTIPHEGEPGAIVTAGGVLFIGATSDNRFRAFDSKTGRELWVTKLGLQRHGNTDDVSG